MECTVNWMPAMGMGFVAETGSGHVLTMDDIPALMERCRNQMVACIAELDQQAQSAPQ